jgi:hypothetical protein
MKLNKYLPVAFIYFFINSVGLPFGLTWTALLAPFFYAWILLRRKQEILWPFFILLLPFIFVHTMITGVDLKSYLISLLNITMVYIFCQAFYTFLKVCNDPEVIFRKILVVNFIFCLIGIIFYFTPWDYIFWISQDLTSGVTDYRRFKLFTYEASIYATLIIPLFFFYVLQYFFRENKIRNVWLFLILLLPVILSFSIGVIGGGLLAMIITIALYRQLLVKRRVVNAIINAGAFSLSALFVLVLFFRNNTLFIRLTNIFTGNDTSANGRIEDSYILARRMLEEKSEWWGIGFGQIKLLGHDIVKEYYRYIVDFTATIPSVMAETLALLGWWGVILRLVIEIFLFFYTKVWTNYYRMMLFLFIFIYQFTGSFITNLAEYVIWILAFTNVFRQFDVKANKQVSTVAGIATA